MLSLLTKWYFSAIILVCYWYVSYFCCAYFLSHGCKGTGMSVEPINFGRERLKRRPVKNVVEELVSKPCEHQELELSQ